MEYVYSTYLLELAERQGARVVNRPRSLRDFNDEVLGDALRPVHRPHPGHTAGDEIRAFLEAEGHRARSRSTAWRRIGIPACTGQDPSIGVVIETLTHYGRRTVMAERYIPEMSAGRQARPAGGRQAAPLPARAHLRRRETRGNLAAGARRRAAAALADHKIAEAVGPVPAADGLLLVGPDVIGDFLAEVNVTSPTGMREIQEQTGFSVAGMMIDALERARHAAERLDRPARERRGTEARGCRAQARRTPSSSSGSSLPRRRLFVPSAG